MHRRDVLIAAAAETAALAAFFSSSRASAQPAERKPAMPYIETRDRAQLFLRDTGKGRPIVFVAAWGLNSLAWQYQTWPLSNSGFRCIAFDRRSHGQSSDPGAGYDLDTLADDLAGVMDQLAVKDAVLIGHSMGAAEIVRYLTRHGSARVSKLVFIAPTTPFLPKTPDNPEGIDPKVTQALLAMAAKDFPGIVAANINPFFVTSTSQAMRNWVQEMMTAVPLHALLGCNRAFSGADFRGDLPKIKLPTLVLQGDADMSNPLPVAGKKTAELMPNATLKVYPGAPHGLIFTHMEQVTADIATFAAA
jgi:pimeloyl-ACP methyl ester carboxylesterase